MINENLKNVEIAPIYDCASCLYPQLTDKRIEEIINDEDEMNARVFIFPTSAIKINDKKINYFEYISSLSNNECNNALVRVFQRINMESVSEIIDDVDIISSVRKGFYKKILNYRYTKILKVNYDKL